MEPSIAVFLCVARRQRPMDLPLSGHDVFNSQLPADYSFLSQSLFIVPPSTQVIFDCFKDHSESTPAQAPIGQQPFELPFYLFIVRPITPVDILLSKERFNCVADGGTIARSNASN